MFNEIVDRRMFEKVCGDNVSECLNGINYSLQSRENLENVERRNRFVTAASERTKVTKIIIIVRNDRRLRHRMITDTVHINETVYVNFYMAKSAPNLFQSGTDDRKYICYRIHVRRDKPETENRCSGNCLRHQDFFFLNRE